MPNLEENLDRFAGSSDEEEEEPMAPPAPAVTTFDNNHDADEENDSDDGEEDDIEELSPRDEYLHDKRSDRKTSDDDGDDDDDSDSSSIEGEEMDVATKMANAMSRILGTETTNSKKKSVPTSSVVLAKTVTPLQKLQQKEKEQQKAIKEKRRTNRERNLTALHIPLSIATTNTIQLGGQLSVAKELEQERFHRRVATRGVVALFNAITQHQKTNNPDNDCTVSSKNKETSKLTKHGFLDKIKAAAKSKGSDEQPATGTPRRGENGAESEGNNSSSWGALKDDYMLDSKKNWDEESSDEEPDEESGDEKVDAKGSTPRKKRRVSGKR